VKKDNIENGSVRTINSFKNIGFNIIRKFIIFQLVMFFSLLSHNAHAGVLTSQKYLNALGYNSGTEDGIWGKKN
jgi:hypothetical protein